MSDSIEQGFGKLAQLIEIARDRMDRAAEIKQAFVPAGAAGGGMPMDPAAAGGGMPMDPAAGGGMPMDPAAGGGMPMDPAAGGMPPMDPAAGGGGDPIEAFRAIVKEELGAAGLGTGGGAAGAGPAGQLKPKIDVNVEIMQIKKMMARLLDTMGVTIPAQEMVATPDDLMQMAQQGGGAPAPAAAGGEMAKPAADQSTGTAYRLDETLERASATRDKAAALAQILGR